MEKRILFSQHALQRLEERGFNPEDTVETIRNPQRIESSFRGRTIAYRTIGEREIRAVYIEEIDHIIVITVYEVKTHGNDL
jgi:hypothetical protein